MNVEAAFSSYINTDADSGKAALAAVDEFSQFLFRMIESSLFSKYVLTYYSPQNTAETITTLTERFSRAIQMNDRKEAVMLAEKIRSKIIEWHELDVLLVNSINMSYFYLFLLFTLIFVLMILILWHINRALRRSYNREKQTAAFSRRIVLAQEDERARIARELHDTVIQELLYFSLRLSSLKRTIPPEEAGEILSEAIRGQEKMMAQLRDICCDLIPPDMKKLDLPLALGQLCVEFEEHSGIECRLSVQEELRLGDLSREMQLQCYRIVQEALTNIRKHAQASEAAVVVRNACGDDNPQDTTLLICISDDGRGFEEIPNPQETGAWGEHPFTGKPGEVFRAAPRMGIRGMYERINILGGVLTFVSIPGEGAMVRIEIPIVIPPLVFPA
jgi:signal transduction histidine kinase